MAGWRPEAGDRAGRRDTRPAILCITARGHGLADPRASFYPSVTLHREANMLKTRLLILGPLFLAACAATAVSDDYAEVIARATPPSPAVKAVIVTGARELIYNPASIRNAEISNVATLPGGGQGVCVRADSKDVSGRYTGVHSLGIPLRDGKIAGGSLDHPICDRADVHWQPFPELEALPG